MVNTDSVSVFTEGTFEEQIHELVEYIARSKPEADRVAFKQPFADSLKTENDQYSDSVPSEKKQEIVQQVLGAVDGLGDGSDREIEGFFNLLFSHIISLYISEISVLSSAISKLISVIMQQTASEQTPVKYRVLANLFNALPRISPVRLTVCNALLKLAVENDEIENLHLSVADTERWLSEWSTSSEEKSAFLKAVADAFSASGYPETAFSFSTSYVRSLASTAPAGPAALELIASALSLPSVFDFDSILKLDAIQTQKAHPLFALLQIFNSQGLEEFTRWKGSNLTILDSFNLDANVLEKKIRLLILSQLGFSKIGQNLTYSEIASALQIGEAEVEKWAIDVIRAGLLSGKLSQTAQTLHVIRASPRGFANEQWKVLEQRLLDWKEGLSGVRSVLLSTRQSATSATVPGVA